MDSTSGSHFVVPTIIDVPELIVTRDDADFDGDESSFGAAWIARLHFLASALSYTLGLGNFWRFPALCFKHSGGAFLVAYTVMLLVVGLPLFLMETAFGQYANEGPITIWRISPAFEGIGYSMCLISALVAVYFNVVNSYTIYYLFGSLTFGELSFSSCENTWNTNNCTFKISSTSGASAFLDKNCSTTDGAAGKQPMQIAGLNSSQLQDWGNILLFPDANQTSGQNSNVQNCTARLQTNPFEFEKIIQPLEKTPVLPSTEYLHNNLLALSGSINEVSGFNFGQWLCLLIAWALVYTAISRGWRLTGRGALAAVVAPYIAFIALLLRALTLDGAVSGVKQYLTPDWPRLQNIDIWADAMTQLFFSLAPCLGAIISLASMNKFHNNFHADATLLVSLNYATSLLCGLIVFALLGFMSENGHADLADVTEKGVSVAFVAYSEGVSQMPLANLFSLAFFTMLLFLGIATQTAVIEFVTSTLTDTWPHKLGYRKPLILIVTCTTMCFLGSLMCLNNGFHVLQLVDAYAGTYTALIVAVFELIAIAWVYGIDNFVQDIDDMISVHRSLFPSRAYWSFMWRYLAPSVVFAVLAFSLADLPTLEYNDKPYPPWTTGFGLTLTLACVAFIPTIAIVRFAFTPSGSLIERINYLCRPSEDWGKCYLDSQKSTIFLCKSNVLVLNSSLVVRVRSKTP